MNRSRRVCIVTSTRADWGLLSPIARKLADRNDIDLSVVATNMHLDPRYGHTVDEIRADGIEVTAEVAVHAISDDDSPASRAVMMGRTMTGMAEAFLNIGPDMVVVLGDRYEMLAVASTAAVMRIPIVHIAGGEITEGAVDDSIRHAITKLSSLYLTATEDYRQRVISMGEDPDYVINTGAIGVYNIMSLLPMSRSELEQSIDFSLGDNALLVTYHPVTMDTPESVATGCSELLKALDRFENCHILITYPNNDACGQVIIGMIEQYASDHPDRVKVVPSLGRIRYISALKCVKAVIGNSSSGIVEVPSAGIPTVDIGDRQKGRLAGESVIHCGSPANEIAEAISYALSTDGQQKAAAATNPYHKHDTLQAIVEAIAGTPIEPLRHKRFVDHHKPI